MSEQHAEALRLARERMRLLRDDAPLISPMSVVCRALLALHAENEALREAVRRELEYMDGFPEVEDGSPLALVIIEALSERIARALRASRDLEYVETELVPDGLFALDSLAAIARDALTRVEVLEAMDMTATAEQWEGEAKRQRERADAAEKALEVPREYERLLSEERERAERAEADETIWHDGSLVLERRAESAEVRLRMATEELSIVARTPIVEPETWANGMKDRARTALAKLREEEKSDTKEGR